MMISLDPVQVILLPRRSRRVRPARISATLDRTLRRIDDGEGGVAVFDLAFPADLRKGVSPALKLRQQGPRQSIFDLHPGPPPFTAADQQAWSLDGLLGGHPAVDDVQNDAVDGGRNPRVPGTADRQPRGEPRNS